MGYNTVILVNNDALATIASDPGFGARLARAVARHVVSGRTERVAALGRDHVCWTTGAEILAVCPSDEGSAPPDGAEDIRMEIIIRELHRLRASEKSD